MQLSDYNLCNLYFCRQCTKTLIFLKFCQPALSTLKIHWIMEKTLSTCWKSLLVVLRWKSSCLFGLYFMKQWTCMLTCICNYHHIVTVSCLFTFFLKRMSIQSCRTNRRVVILTAVKPKLSRRTPILRW